LSFLDRIRSLVPYVDKGGDSDESPFGFEPTVKVITRDSIVEKGWDELRSNAISAVSNANPGQLVPTVSSIQAINKYRSWVYDCVNIISRKGSTVPYYLYREVGQPNDEEFDRILDHKIVKLLKRPNRFMTGRELRAYTHMHLDLTGMAFWWIIRDGLGEPAELHLLYPHNLVNIEKGENTSDLIKQFKFSPLNNTGGKNLELDYRDVVYFHYPHPGDVLLGCSPIQAIAHQTDIDLYLQVYEKTFFQNGARPDYLIVAEQDISPQEVDRFYENLNARHRGPGKNYKPMIINRNVRIEPLSMNARDFEFIGMSEWTKDCVLACYGIPEAMLGLYESFNKASSLTAETTFVKECLEPRLFMMADAINTQLIPEFRNVEGLEFKFESALPKDDEFEMAKNQADLTMGLTTINEIRKKNGKSGFKSPWASVPLMNGQPLPGEDDEADKLFKDMMQPQMGMAGGMGGDPMAGAMGGDTSMGQQAPSQPMPPSNAPAAQGAMGAMGGRPPGGELKTLLQDSLRSSKPGLSTLLNAARGRRGGLSGLLGSHPELHQLQELLNAKRNDQTLAKLMSKTIYDYIKKEHIPEEEWDTFDICESYMPKWDDLESEYKQVSEDFYVTKGQELSEIVEKALSESDITTKDPLEDIDEDKLRMDYKEGAQDIIEKAARIGFTMGVKLVEKAANENFDPIDASKEAAGKFLDKSADLRVSSTKKALKKIIKTGLDRGLDASRVAELIYKEFQHLGARRAYLIASTELGGAIVQGQKESYYSINKEAGKPVVKKAISWSALDDRVCDDPNPDKNCTKWHGRELIDFENGVEIKELPHHPGGCRCLYQPVVDMETKGAMLRMVRKLLPEDKKKKEKPKYEELWEGKKNV
jgi:HK97 family phage portal protein